MIILRHPKPTPELRAKFEERLRNAGTVVPARVVDIAAIVCAEETDALRALAVDLRAALKRNCLARLTVDRCEPCEALFARCDAAGVTGEKGG